MRDRRFARAAAAALTVSVGDARDPTPEMQPQEGHVGGKADSINPVDTGNGQLVVTLAAPVGDEIDVRLQWRRGLTAIDLEFDEPTGVVPTANGCLRIESRRPGASGTGILTEVCGIAVASDETTELALPVVEFDLTEFGEVDAGIMGPFAEISGGPVEAVWGWGPRRELVPGRPHAIAPGQYGVARSARSNVHWAFWRAAGFPLFDLDLDWGDSFTSELPPWETRSMFRLVPPATRELPDPPESSGCLVGTFLEGTNQNGTTWRWRMDPAAPQDFSYFPFDNVEYAMLINGFRVPIDPDDLTEIETYRIDVGHVATSERTTWGRYRVWNSDGIEAEQMCPGGGTPWSKGYFTGRGIDLPAGDYTVEIEYTTPAGEDKVQVHAITLGD